MSNLRRVLRPLPLTGIALAGAATLTAALILAPSDTPAAQAAESLPGYDNCTAFADGMRSLVEPRVGPYGLNSPTGSRAIFDSGPAVQMGGAPAVMQAPAAPAAAPAAAAAAAPAAAAPAAASTTTAGSASDGADTAAVAKAAPAAKAAAESEPGQAVGTSATGTNVQEAGVDEADLAKTDGKLLVSFAHNALQVVDVRGDTPRPRGSVALSGANPTELLLEGDRVLAITAATAFGSTASAGSTRLDLIDVSDPDRPRLLSTEEVDANYLSARLSDGIARIVISAPPALHFTSPGQWSDGDRMDEPAAAAENRRIVEQARPQDWIPNRRVTDETDRTSVTEPLLNCSDIRHPAADSGTDLLTVVSIDSHAAKPLLDETSTAVVAAGDLVYAATDKLFVATTDGGWGDQWRAGNFHKVTRIHAFDISHGPARYLASGQVDGFLYGRWAMSERDGLLRLVTTDGTPWGWSGANRSSVIVLDTAGRKLDEVGRTDNIAPGEQVKAVRWFDDLAAIVTFRQTDPLQLVDLSRPTSPVVRGVLQVPGYSEYLHPIGDRRLLGLGRAVTETGPSGGLGISSFDILDVTNPRLTSTLGLGRSASSPAEQDPRGFVYLPDQRLAVFPVQPQPKCWTTAFVCSGIDGQIHLPHGPGLVSVRVDKDGNLTQSGSWTTSTNSPAAVLKALPLPDGRIAVLDGRGVTLLRSADLSELGRSDF